MWDQLLDAFREIRVPSDDRVVVLTGAGGDFCSGADLSGTDGEAGSGNPLSAHAPRRRACIALHRLPQPVIAKVGGVAVGAGLNMALGVRPDRRRRDARFSEIFARRGLTIDFGGSYVLPRLVGLHKAKELALLRRHHLGAKEADRARHRQPRRPATPSSTRSSTTGPPASRPARRSRSSMTKRLLNEGARRRRSSRRSRPRAWRRRSTSAPPTPPRRWRPSSRSAPGVPRRLNNVAPDGCLHRVQPRRHVDRRPRARRSASTRTPSTPR